MTVVIFALSVVLTWVTALNPILQARRRAAIARGARDLREAQIYIIKRYHPAFKPGSELAALSFSEISRRFDVDGTYNEIR